MCKPFGERNALGGFLETLLGFCRSGGHGNASDGKNGPHQPG
jgi:hypothetical protein